MVRTIFDSCYLRPEENPRVINYTDAAKAFIIADAEKRNEDKVIEFARRNSQIEQRMQEDREKDEKVFREPKLVFKEQQKKT